MLEKIFSRNKHKTETMQLIGLQGAESAQKLEQRLLELEGVAEVAVLVEDEKKKISYNTAQIKLSDLQSAIKSNGLEALKPIHGEDGNCCGGCT